MGTAFLDVEIMKTGLTEEKINAIFEVTYMTDGSGVYHGEYKGLKPTVWATFQRSGLFLCFFMQRKEQE